MCSLSDKPEMACDRHVLLAKCLIPRVHAHAHDPTVIKYPILHSAHEFQQTCTESIRRPQSRDASRDASRDVLCSIEKRVSGRALESASSDDQSAFFFCLACAHRWLRFTCIAARRARLRARVSSIRREGACSESQPSTSA